MAILPITEKQGELTQSGGWQKGNGSPTLSEGKYP
jgi:hypothetical protein